MCTLFIEEGDGVREDHVAGAHRAEEEAQFGELLGVLHHCNAHLILGVHEQRLQQTVNTVAQHGLQLLLEHLRGKSHDQLSINYVK